MNTRSILLFASLAAAACASSPEDTDAGTQIGGVDCEYDKLDLTVVDDAGTAIASQVSVTFPNGDVLEDDCPASGCQLELDGAGAYQLSVTSTAGSASESFTLDDSNEAGMLSADCGNRPFHELDLTVSVSDDGGGGGDLLTSNIGLRAFDSAGNPASGTATITPPSGTAWTRTCGTSRCWIDIDGPGDHAIAFVGDNGEEGSANVVVDASHLIGQNELGDDVYEVELEVHLTATP